MKKPKNNGLSAKYEAAWHKLFYELPKFKQEVIIEEPHGRYASELAHEVAKYVEKETNLIPSGNF